MPFKAKDYVDAEPTSLKQLLVLKQGGFQIPAYQRNYSWGEEQLEKLWCDLGLLRGRVFINSRIVSGPQPHFIGAFVMIKEDQPNEPLEVVDGQQRLATVIILASTMHGFAERMSDPDKRRNVSSGILRFISDDDAQAACGRRSKLRLGRDHEFFEASIVARLKHDERESFWKRSDQARRPIPRRIIAAEKFFNDKLSELVKGKGAAAFDASIYELWICVSDFLIGLKLDVLSAASAYRIFETLNYRGLDLSQIDLIKNELFRIADDEGVHDRVVSKWNLLMERVEDADLPDKLGLQTFIQFHFSSKYIFVQREELFDKVSDWLREKPVRVEGYVADLYSEFSMYLDSINGADHWTKKSNSMLHDIKEFLDVAYIYPFIMSAARVFRDKPDEFESAVRNALNFSFRYFVVSRNQYIGLAKILAESGRKLRKSPGSLKGIVTSLRKLSPDTAFLESFDVYRPKNVRSAFWVLRQIEHHISGEEGVGVFDQSPHQHLEHIMPKKPGSEWGGIEEEELFKEYRERLGNLLVLEGTINRHIKNKGFVYKQKNEKKKDYFNSKCRLPRKLLEFVKEKKIKKWGFKTIREWQCRLAKEYACAVWSLK